MPTQFELERDSRIFNKNLLARYQVNPRQLAVKIDSFHDYRNLSPDKLVAAVFVTDIWQKILIIRSRRKTDLAFTLRNQLAAKFYAANQGGIGSREYPQVVSAYPELDFRQFARQELPIITQPNPIIISHLPEAKQSQLQIFKIIEQPKYLMYVYYYYLLVWVENTEFEKFFTAVKDEIDPETDADVSDELSD